MTNIPKVDCAFLDNKGGCWAVIMAARDGVAIKVDSTGKCVAELGLESQCDGHMSGKEALARAKGIYSKKEKE